MCVCVCVCIYKVYKDLMTPFGPPNFPPNPGGVFERFNFLFPPSSDPHPAAIMAVLTLQLILLHHFRQMFGNTLRVSCSNLKVRLADVQSPTFDIPGG